MIKVNTKVNANLSDVKKAFVDKEGKLLKFLLPFGTKVLHYKGIRRGAILKLKLLLTALMLFGYLITSITSLTMSHAVSS